MYIYRQKYIVRKRGRGREFVQTGMWDGHLMYVWTDYDYLYIIFPCR